MFTSQSTPADVVLTMFREVALVTFTAGMLGTSAATLYNANVGVEGAQPPAIERPAAQPAPSSSKQRRESPKRDSDLVAFDLRRER